MDEFNYQEKMIADLLEQFRGKKNIGAIVAAYARQLQEVYDFLVSLLNLLDLDLCTGAQLDLIGEIVVLSRYDARVMVEQSYEGEVLDDDLYRKLIKWKILLNTNDCTYWSIMKGIKMFWDKTPVYYQAVKDPEGHAGVQEEAESLSEGRPRSGTPTPRRRSAVVIFAQGGFSMASVALGTKAVGSIVKLKESGVAVNYIVVHQGKPSSIYDESCNGTWLLRQDIAENRVWDDGDVNKLEYSDIHAYLITWITRYDEDIRNAIKQVKIPYRKNGGSGGSDQTGANGLSCKVFLLSGYEVGWTTSTNPYFPVDGAVLSYFQGTASTDAKRIAKLNGTPVHWWLRSPYTSSTSHVWNVCSNGSCDYWSANNSLGVRPALILPSTLLVSDDGSITTNTAPTTPSSITIPSSISGGSTITVKWGPAPMPRVTSPGTRWRRVPTAEVAGARSTRARHSRPPIMWRLERRA